MTPAAESKQPFIQVQEPAPTSLWLTGLYLGCALFVLVVRVWLLFGPK